MAQRAVLDAVAAADVAGTALARVARATAGAAAAARSGAQARGRVKLGGARVARCEKLLEVARDELRVVREALARTAGAADGGDDTEVTAGVWHTPPVQWWRERRDELVGAATKALAECDRTRSAWDGRTDGDYVDVVRRMAREAEELNTEWKRVLEESGHWREVAAAVADGLPASAALTVRMR